MVKTKALKKPNIKDYMCDECGVVHDWAYQEALKEYNKKNCKVENSLKTFILHSFDAHAYGGMLLAQLDIGNYRVNWKHNWGAFPRETAEMFLALVNQGGTHFTDEEIKQVKSILRRERAKKTREKNEKLKVSKQK